MKAVLFCRVSSKEQEETGYSLTAQEKLLRDYAHKHLFEASKIFSISESASGKSQREIFSKMINYVQRENIKIVVCEKVDRLTRNFKDAVTIDEWLEKDEERQVHLVKDSLILHKNSRSQEKLNWGIRILFAKNYIDNLSEEVKKGQKEKIAQGWLPTKAPYGYKTVGEKGKKIHIIDKDRAQLIKRMFKYYSTSNYSLKRLTEKMYGEGLRSDNGNKVAKSRIHGLLKDPFYIGKIRWNGKNYNGRQEPLVSRELFADVQMLLERKSAPKYRKHNFLFKGLIGCVECGGTITWEIHKGHIYGHCNHYRNCTQSTWSREQEIENQLLDGFEKLQIKNERLMEWVRKALKDSHNDEIEFHTSAMSELQEREKRLKQRMDKLYDEKLDGKISEKFYDRKFTQYSEELENITGSIKKFGSASTNYFEQGISLYDLSQRARESYLKAKKKNLLNEQRKLIRLIFSNLTINKEKLSYEYMPVFKLLSKAVRETNSSKIAKDKLLLDKIFEPKENLENTEEARRLEVYRSALLPG